MSYSTSPATPQTTFRKRLAKTGVGAAVALVAALTLPFAVSATAAADEAPQAANGESIIDGWVKPATGQISDGYGPRPEKPVPGVNPFHKGTDIAASCGAPIVAATAGKIIEAEEQGSYGNWMLVEHDDGSETGYAHIAPNGYTAEIGDRVDAGQQIAKVGTTGASTGCHLHFEVRKDGDRIDPEIFFQERHIEL